MQTLLKGLTSADVAEQQRLGHTNVTPDSTSKSAARIVFENIFTYFNLIFAVLAAMLIFVGSYRSLTFLPVVIANMVIGIVQQLRAKKILDDLAVLAMAECCVVRDGSQGRVPIDQLVLGDIVFLESGQQIPADAEVLEGKVLVNEALLTGESDEIEKLVGAELMSGSFIVSGSCFARLTRVGADSYVAKLTAQAKQVKDRQSEMVRGIDLFVKVAGIAIIPIGVALVWEALAWNGATLEKAITSMVGAVIGMIPEGLYLLVTIALALSAARLARLKVLLHDMRSTEALARVDVLCVDKTGTITSNDMTVSEVFSPASAQGLELPAGAAAEDAGEEVTSLVDPQLRAGAECLARYISTVTDTNITMLALRSHFTEVEPFADPEVTPFSSKVKYSQVESGGITYRLGAPEFLLDEADKEANRELIEERAGRGERVLALVRSADEETSDFDPVVFVSLKNGLRPNVAETFAYLRDQEVSVKVISGDNPLTVSTVAASVGIPGSENYVDATTLSTEEDVRDAVQRYTVFGRVKPEQKKQLVLAFKQQGNQVAMTGDGVNDILAMKEADCSIAMGAGSDAAMQAAQVVLLDSDFSHMRDIISEGRRDINNITRSSTLFLYKNLFSFMLAAFSIITFFTYPLQPSQVSLISAFNIGIPAFLLALEPNEKKQQGHFLSQVLIKSMPAAITSFAAIAAMVVFADLFGISSEEVSTASTYLLSVVGFIVLKNICTPFNRYRVMVMVGSIIGFIASTLALHGLFSITKISPRCVVLCVIFAIAEESIMRNIGWLIEHWDEVVARIRGQLSE